ncbi:hypothetical protein GCM10027275_12740 [Rhabdobacter roseus]
MERDIERSIREPQWRLNRQRTEQRIQEYMQTNRARLRQTDEIIRIPVVVHVIHDQEPGSIGGINNPNISDEQISSQIEVLNEDYRREPGTRGFNTNPVGADTRIEFYLADLDPEGRSTSGITRTQYTQRTSFNPFTDDQLLSNIAYWPSDKYLNIWVCRLSGTYLGIAQFPSVEGVGGLDNANESFERTDGVIIDFRFFGRQTGAITSRIYNLGRTTTHEVGHWLGLIHTWGDVDCGTDYCDDTPPTLDANRTTVCTDKFSNCLGPTTRNMIENYLDYSPDSCMNIFTKCQAERMQAVLALSPRRARLVEFAREGRLEPTDNLTVEIFPNPITNELTELKLDVRFADFQDLTLLVYDARGVLLQTLDFQSLYSRRIPLDVSTYPPGMYFVRARTRLETVTKRFVVVK